MRPLCHAHGKSLNVRATAHDFTIQRWNIRQGRARSWPPRPFTEVMQEYSQIVIEFVRQNHWWALPIVFALAFGESLAFLSLFIPAWALLVAIGALINASGLVFWPIWLAAAVGAACGDWLSYWFGFHFKDRIAHTCLLYTSPSPRD